MAKCTTRYCRNPKAKQNGYELRYCWKCKSRLLKQRHPVTYFFNTLRHSAKKRDIPFTLTLEEFRGFCARTNFIQLKGKKPDDLTIDRIESKQGYSLNNIRTLPHKQNSAQGKYNLPRYLREQYENETNH